MEDWLKKRPPKMIIRQAEVLRRTGFSRSTLYLRIANGEFPRQLSLGARSVGWIEEEVDAWIKQRASMRPDSGSQIWSLHEESQTEIPVTDSTPDRPESQKPTKSARRPEEPKRHGTPSRPDLTQLELIGTNVYVDKVSGTLWFQVLRPKQPTDLAS